MSSMYQLWMDNGGSLRPIAKFRSLEEALERVSVRSTSCAFAIQFPDGDWYRDRRVRTMLPGGERPPAALARGSRRIDVSAFRGMNAAGETACVGDDESTDVQWPPHEDSTDVRWPPDDGPTVPMVKRSRIFG